MLDPPWPEHGGGKIKRGADRHYKTLSLRDIPRVILSSGVYRPKPGGHIYLWVTNTHLVAGIYLLNQIGGRYVTMLTWGKDKAGLGQYFRGQTEHMLFGVYGGTSGYETCTPLRNLSTLITAPRTEHSRKPDAAYELVEKRSKGPYLSMFDRRLRDGWDMWGDEVPTEDATL